MTRCRVRVYDAGDDKALLRRAARLAVKNERLPFPCVMDVILISDREMRELNRMRRGVNKVTDVLSFPMWNPGDKPDPDTGRVYIGDVLIAKKRAKKQAKEYNHSLERELAYLTAHGALHLLGFDHETDWDRAVMRKKEEAVMERLGLLR
ncbi:MAG: rRNA maturation RNase YbeY [Oscillospiraceae bacterium]|jgi:probable rRNA maturation factor|nr:rRNA maturation RNase YbeY [Oscillospiraceae bacterium]